jgi:hypothetical protein
MCLSLICLIWPGNALSRLRQGFVRPERNCLFNALALTKRFPAHSKTYLRLAFGFSPEGVRTLAMACA